MMGIVCGKRKPDERYMVVRVHACHAEYLIKNVRQQSPNQMHVYYFDSLSTTIREFRTIKCCEFYDYADFILNPKPN
jgi:hypothetical protein